MRCTERGLGLRRASGAPRGGRGYDCQPHDRSPQQLAALLPAIPHLIPANPHLVGLRLEPGVRVEQHDRGAAGHRQELAQQALKRPPVGARARVARRQARRGLECRKASGARHSLPEAVANGGPLQHLLTSPQPSIRTPHSRPPDVVIKQRLPPLVVVHCVLDKNNVGALGYVAPEARAHEGAGGAWGGGERAWGWGWGWGCERVTARSAYQGAAAVKLQPTCDRTQERPHPAPAAPAPLPPAAPGTAPLLTVTLTPRGAYSPASQRSKRSTQQLVGSS
jgi:hypothetical protein